MAQTLSRPLVLAALLLAAAPVAASAQVEPAPLTPSAPLDPSQGTSTPDTPSDPCVAVPGQAGGDQSLTGQLTECGGVLAPPPTGSTGIEAPVPDPDPQTTPVIPPADLPDVEGAT